MPNRTSRLVGALPRGVDPDGEEKQGVSIAQDKPPPDACRDCPYIRDEDLPASWIAKMRPHVLHIVRNPSAVEDVMQDLRESLLRQTREQWNAIKFKESYVWQAARHAAYQWLRKEKTRNSLYENYMRHQQHKMEGELQDPTTQACALDELARMLRPVGARGAEAFLRVHYWGLSHTETAALMGITVGGVKKHLERVDEHFQRLLEQDKVPSAGSRLMKFFRRGDGS